MQARVSVLLPQLSSRQALLQNLLQKHQLRLLHHSGPALLLATGPALGRTEFAILATFFTGVKDILEFENSFN